MPAVTLIGPRQSGKTTLVRDVFPGHAYVSLERPDERQQARSDGLGFLRRFAGVPLILDEVQNAPELLSYLQVEIDSDDRPGRFVLTGSQNLPLMDKVAQTLAGRTAILRLLPLSLSELYGRPAITPDQLDRPIAEPVPPPDPLWEVVFRGFYPRIHGKGLDPGQWLADYRQTYVERDLRDVLRVMDLDAFDRFLRLVAARTGQELKYADLAADAGITLPTAKQWTTALRVGFIVALAPAHHSNFRKRVRKQPRLHFLDTGLACHLLGISSAKMLETHPLRGAIFESYVFGELTKAFWNQRRESPIFFWRDATGHEIDLLLDLGPRLVPIEVKSGASLPADAASGLSWWTNLAGNPNHTGVLIHGGTRAGSLHGFAVRPWFLA